MNMKGFYANHIIRVSYYFVIMPVGIF